MVPDATSAARTAPRLRGVPSGVWLSSQLGAGDGGSRKRFHGVTDTVRVTHFGAKRGSMRLWSHTRSGEGSSRRPPSSFQPARSYPAGTVATRSIALPDMYLVCAQFGAVVVRPG